MKKKKREREIERKIWGILFSILFTHAFVTQISILLASKNICEKNPSGIDVFLLPKEM